MEMVNSTKAYEYALFCANNIDRKIPKYVKKQAIQWLEIVEGNNDEACFFTYLEIGRAHV